MKLTDHFSVEEASCKDGTFLPEELKQNAIKVATNLEVLRFAFGGSAININSWYRTKEYNAKQEGSSPNSQHLSALAADIWIFGIKPITLYHVIEALIRVGKMEEGGLGIYNTFVHYDNRGFRARWDLRK